MSLGRRPRGQVALWGAEGKDRRIGEEFDESPARCKRLFTVNAGSLTIYNHSLSARSDANVAPKGHYRKAAQLLWCIGQSQENRTVSAALIPHF